MDVSAKSHPHRAQYLRALASMSPEQRLAKAFEFSDWSRALLMAGLRERFPALEPEELSALHVEQLLRCHSRAS